MGLTLVFGVMKIVNFAHGEFYMLGAYAIYVLYARNSWPYFAALVMGIVLVGLLGAVTERIIFRPLRGQLIPGFEQGVTGMKVGGKRTITIPPSLGYGEQGAGDAIPPNSTITFELELVDVK